MSQADVGRTRRDRAAGETQAPCDKGNYGNGQPQPIESQKSGGIVRSCYAGIEQSQQLLRRDRDLEISSAGGVEL